MCAYCGRFSFSPCSSWAVSDVSRPIIEDCKNLGWRGEEAKVMKVDKMPDDINLANPLDYVDVYNEYQDNKVADPVSPDHYSKYAIEPIDFISKNQLGFNEGNVVKYIVRHGTKNGAEDVRKAIRYCEFILKYQYGEEK